MSGCVVEECSIELQDFFFMTSVLMGLALRRCLRGFTESV